MEDLIEKVFQIASGNQRKARELEIFSNNCLYEPGVDDLAVLDYWGRESVRKPLIGVLNVFSTMNVVETVAFFGSIGLEELGMNLGKFPTAMIASMIITLPATVLTGGAYVYLTQLHGAFAPLDGSTYREMRKVSKKNRDYIRNGKLEASVNPNS